MNYKGVWRKVSAWLLFRRGLGVSSRGPRRHGLSLLASAEGKAEVAPETQKTIAGIFTGQEVALVILVKALHANGVLDGYGYIKALKTVLDDPNAKHERPSYEYLRELVLTLEEELAPLPQFPREK